MDTVGALVSILKADSGVSGSAGTRVYGDELPQDATSSMPEDSVVVRSAGGGSTGGAEKRWGDLHIDIDCYSDTPKGAGDLYGLVRIALAGIDRSTVTVDGVSILTHWAHESMRAQTGREPDTHWPICVGSWQVLAAEA